MPGRQKERAKGEGNILNFYKSNEFIYFIYSPSFVSTRINLKVKETQVAGWEQNCHTHLLVYILPFVTFVKMKKFNFDSAKSEKLL